MFHENTYLILNYYSATKSIFSDIFSNMKDAQNASLT